MSLAGPSSVRRPAACSGLMKPNVPTSEPIFVGVTSPSDWGRRVVSPANSSLLGPSKVLARPQSTTRVSP